MKYRTKKLLRRVIFLTVMLALVVTAIFFTVRHFVNKANAAASLYALPADAGQVYEMKSGYAAIQGNVLTRMDANVKVMFSTELKDKGGLAMFPEGTQVKVCGTKSQTAVYGGNTLYIYDSAGTLLVQHTLEAEILSMILGDEAYAVVVLQDGQRKVSVYRTDTTPMDENILFPYQSVLDVGMFDNDRQLWTLSLDVHATQPVSMVKTRNIGLTTTASLSVDGETVYHVEPYANGFVTVGTQTLRLWDSKGSEVTTLMVYGWVLQDMETDSRGRLQFLFCPADPDGSGVRSMLWYLRLEEDGTTTQYRYSLPADTMGCCFTEKDIAAVTPMQICRIPYQGGSHTTRDLPVAVEDFRIMEYQHSLIILSGGKEYLVHLD